MSATIESSKFTIFGHGHDYTLNNSGNGNGGKQIFSHPFVPLGSTIYAGQFYFDAPVYDEEDLSKEPVITDVVRFDNNHCTFTPALGSIFSTTGTVTVTAHYYREYEGEEETIVVERNFSQDITVVDHGNVESAYGCTTHYSDGYLFITNPLWLIRDDPQHIPDDEQEYEDYTYCNLNPHSSEEGMKISSLPFRLRSVDCIDSSMWGVDDLSELAYADVSTVESFSSTFVYCTASDFSALANWDISGVTHIERMFEHCEKLSDLSFMAGWHFENNVTIDLLFFYCEAITSLDGLEIFDTSNITEFHAVFCECTSLSDVSAVANWDVSNCIDFSGMFEDCDISDLTPFTNWDMSSCTNVATMFAYNRNLTSLHGLENWDVSATTNMTGLFMMRDGWLNHEAWSKLVNISAIENWDVSNVTSMNGMFKGCKWLTNLMPISEWDVSNVTNMYQMFYGGSALLDVSALNNWDFTSVTDMRQMFHNYTDFYHINYPPVIDDMIFWMRDGDKNIYVDYNRSVVYNVPDLYATKYSRDASASSLWSVSGQGKNAFDNNWLNLPSWN